MTSSVNLNTTISSCGDCSSKTAPQFSPAIEGSGPLFVNGEYQQFSQQVRVKTIPLRVPTNGSIEIIENCNFRCIHCYQGQNKARNTLSGDRWCEIIDEIAASGTLWLLITGGEPLLHPEFEKIYRHCIQSGMLVTLFTNGAMIKDHHIALFKELPPFSIEITLYGASEEMYQKVTQTKNSFEKVRTICQRLIDEKLPLKLKSVAFKPLMNDIPDIKSWAENQLGLTFRFDTKIDPGIYGDSFDDIRANPEELVDLEMAMVKKENMVMDMKHFQNLHEKRKMNMVNDTNLYTCGAGKNSYYIDYKGYVHTCSTGRLEDEAFDLNKMSFHEIWFNKLPDVIFQEVRDKNSICRTCEFRGFCDVCPATAKLATGSKEGRPQYICQHTMMRKKRFLDQNQETI